MVSVVASCRVSTFAIAVVCRLVQVNKMSMSSDVDREPLQFTLTDRTPGSDMMYIIQVSSSDVKDTWIKEVRGILDMQGDFLRGMT